MNRRLILAASVFGLLLVLPHVAYPVLLMKLMCFGLFACAFNLLLGYTGLLSFGHAAFFGLSAYVTGHAIKVWGFTPELGVLAGTVTGLTLGVVVGAVAIRRQGIYFAMITLALAQMVYFLCLQLPFTGGEDGLQEVPRGRLLGTIDLASDVAMYYFVLAMSIAALWLIHRVIDSPFGQIAKAIRDNEARAQSLGYDVNRFKLMVFVLSAAISGLAGALKVLVFQFATLSDVHWHASGEVVLMTLLGGLGTELGPIAGAAVVVLLQNGLSDKVGSLVTVIMGVIFMTCVLVFRKGIAGSLAGLVKRRPTA